jgi:hypothetical protein
VSPVGRGRRGTARWPPARKISRRGDAYVAWTLFRSMDSSSPRRAGAS